MYEVTIQYNSHTDSLNTHLTHISRLNTYKSFAIVSYEATYICENFAIILNKFLQVACFLK
jgi:hypothetical protein